MPRRVRPNSRLSPGVQREVHKNQKSPTPLSARFPCADLWPCVSVGRPNSLAPSIPQGSLFPQAGSSLKASVTIEAGGDIPDRSAWDSHPGAPRTTVEPWIMDPMHWPAFPGISTPFTAIAAEAVHESGLFHDFNASATLDAKVDFRDGARAGWTCDVQTDPLAPQTLRDPSGNPWSTLATRCEATHSERRARRRPRESQWPGEGLGPTCPNGHPHPDRGGSQGVCPRLRRRLHNLPDCH